MKKKTLKLTNGIPVILKGRIVTDDGINQGYIRIEKGIITESGCGNLVGKNVLDLGNAFIIPGFIDLHMHGIHRYLVDNGPDDLAEICKILPRYGVTGFLPTVAPKPKGKDALFLNSLAGSKTAGAEILGFHLEGPFLKLSGSLTDEASGNADIGRVKSLIEAALPFKTIFSISPDFQGIETLIPLMTANKTPAFITHTAANVEETQTAIDLGVRHATHFYDVFPCPSVNDPGVRPCGAVETILADERVSVDFILDGVHVDPVAVRMAMACKAKGPGCVCLITDSNVGAGLVPGRFIFGDSGEIEFAYKGAPARKVKDQTLAGSGLTMDIALKNAMEWLGTELPEAVRMLSANPAKVIGVDDHKGKLLAGFDADLVVLDQQLDVMQTWVAGECKYIREN